MNKELEIELIKHQEDLLNMAKFIDALQIETEYKVMFLALISTRGIKNAYKYAHVITHISNNGCEVIKLLLTHKTCGIELMHLISTVDNLNTRVEIYKNIMEHGTKKTDIDKLMCTTPNLLDFIN